MNVLNAIVLKVVIIHWAVLSSASHLKSVGLQRLDVQPQEAEESKNSALLRPEKGVESHHSHFELTNVQTGQKKYRPALPTTTKTTYLKSYPKIYRGFKDGFQIVEDQEERYYDPTERETWNNKPKFSGVFEDNNSGQTNSSPEDISAVIKSKLTNNYENGLPDGNKNHVERSILRKSVIILPSSRVVEDSSERTKPRLTFGTEDPIHDSPGLFVKGKILRENPYMSTRKVEMLEYKKPKTDTAEYTYQYNTKSMNKRLGETRELPQDD